MTFLSIKFHENRLENNHRITITYHASRTCLVSGHAQHALHFGFSPVLAGSGGVTDETSVDLDDELPIVVDLLNR